MQSRDRRGTIDLGGAPEEGTADGKGMPILRGRRGTSCRRGLQSDEDDRALRSWV